MTGSGPQPWARLDTAIAVALPLAMLGIAYALIAAANALVVIGPFDRAVWGWIILPLAWIAPVIAGTWWARLAPRVEWVVRFATFTILTAVVGVFLASVTGTIACEPATLLTALPRGLVAGTVAGGGFVLAASLSAAAVRKLEGWWARGLALLGCALIGVVTFFGVLLAWVALMGVAVPCAPGPPT